MDNVVGAESQWVERGVLIYGAAKSGTSLLQSLMDGGRDYMVLPGELKLKWVGHFNFLERAERELEYVERAHSALRRPPTWGPETLAGDTPAGDTGWWFSSGTLSDAELAEVFSPSRYAESTAGWFRGEGDTLAAVVRRHMRGFRNALGTDQKYTGWVCKEVGGNPWLVTSLFKSLFPEGRIVLIGRDPRFVVRSIILDRRRKGLRLSARKIVVEYLKAWRMTLFLWRIRDLPGKVVVLYEDLVADVAPEMQRVMEFLEAEASAVHTTPTTMGVESKVRTSSRDTTAVFSHSTQSWKRDLSFRERMVIRALEAARVFATWRVGNFPKSYEDLRDVYARMRREEDELGVSAVAEPQSGP